MRSSLLFTHFSSQVINFILVSIPDLGNLFPNLIFIFLTGNGKVSDYLYRLQYKSVHYTPMHLLYRLTIASN